VVIGRDIHADVRVADPLISRAHLVLRFDHGVMIIFGLGRSAIAAFIHQRHQIPIAA
jgi:pSer/pThr/pTyr-binding forkhead associated (FHA) protein